jgi:integrase
MAESAGRQNAGQHQGIRRMGRGPGVRAASASSIQIDFKFAGVRCREKLTIPPTAANLRYARRFKASIEHDIALGRFDYAKHFPNSPRAKLLSSQRGSVYTVREILGAWLDSAEKELEPETYDDYEQAVRGVWLPTFGALPVDQLTVQRVRDWVAVQDRSKKRILNLLTPLRQALRLAVEDGILPADPLANLRVQRPDRLTEDLIDPFTPAEVAAVTAKLPEQTANLAQFWAWTGLREGELLALTWPDADLERAAVRITKAARGTRVKVPKTRSGNRTVKLLQPALDALKRQQAHTRLAGKAIFLNPLWRPQAGSRWKEPQPGPWNEKELRQAWEAACVVAGVRYRPPRQLRHTFASWTLSAGESPIWVARMMGHRDASITQRVYARFIPEVIPDAGSRTVAAIGKTR